MEGIKDDFHQQQRINQMNSVQFQIFANNQFLNLVL